jgi:hypothetical protein
MKKFVKQLNDTFPEIQLPRSRKDYLDRVDSLDLSLSESESQRLREKAESLYFLSLALVNRSRPEKSSGQQSTKSQPESTTNSQSTTKQKKPDSQT